MSGVLCNRRIIIEVKGRVYKTVVRPALKYGAETWPVKRVQEKKLDVVEMKMLRWMCGGAKMDRIKNERIRGTTKVIELSKKAQETRLQWCGHVMRRGETYIGRRVMQMEMPGGRKPLPNCKILPSSTTEASEMAGHNLGAQVSTNFAQT
ncbi:uncharacterized protein [Macrobrachium rosenbergii]|uniref:uncharacterized protein n=1 Tax=Macrobrachium rosenbergii TaxID=79674 RepID=UPI0034D6A8A2